MNRRAFISLLGGAAAWPLAARAQPSALPVVGFLASTSPGEYTYVVDAFRQGLRQTGHVDGQNVAIEYRWARNQYDHVPALATELVRRPVAVLVTGGGTVTALAAKAATGTIPIVFLVGGDPVESGLVTSLNRPGGNVTGVSFLATALDAKRLELLREIAPKATIAVLINPNNPNADSKLKEVEQAARTIGQELLILRANAESDLYTAFAAIVERRAAALLIDSDPFFTNHRDQVALLATRHGLPSIYAMREYAVAGGLMSYGTSFADAYRQLGIYAGRILSGERPADLPVVQPTKFELVINLKTARALGLTVPPTLLVAADEVIE